MGRCRAAGEQGATVADLNDLRAALGPEETCVTLQYFARYLRSTRSVDTLIHSTARIFDLISAIKAYSNMDRAAILEVDVPRGWMQPCRCCSHA